MSAPSLDSQPRLLPAPQAQSSLDQSWPWGGGSEMSLPAVSAEPEARRLGPGRERDLSTPPNPVEPGDSFFWSWSYLSKINTWFHMLPTPRTAPPLRHPPDTAESRTGL